MKDWNWILWSAFTLVVTAASGTAAHAAICSGRPCINVGAFNIKLLGNDGPADTPAEYREIGRLLAQTMDLDVLSLEEINVRSTEWGALRSELEARGYAVAFESAFGGERDQYIVILYRPSSVQLTSPAPSDLDFPTIHEETGSDCRYDNVRPPVEASFRAGSFDFRLIGVHLKSQIQVGRDPQCDDRIRAAQAAMITRHISQTAGQDRDVIIVGDFNSAYAARENQPFRSAGMMSAMDGPPPRATSPM